MRNSTFSKPDSTANELSLRQTLQRLGADKYDLALPESHHIGKLLQPGEVLEGIVFGRYHRSNGPPGRGVLAATDRRVIFLDRKPFSLIASEISYHVINGVSYGATGLVSTVTLNTRTGDIAIRTFNTHTPDGFVRAIEDRVFTGPADFRPISPKA